MSYVRLFSLLNIGLKEKNIGTLIEKFKAIGIDNVVTYDEILKAIRQTSLIDDVIEYLIENNIIEEYGHEEEITYKILIDFPKTADEKNADNYINSKLNRSKKELLINKLNYYVSKKKQGWIVFLDLANSTDKYGGESDIIINKDFPNAISNAVDMYFSNTSGYLIKQYGDEAYLYFFDKNEALEFIENFIQLYNKDVFEKIEKYNKTRKIKNAFKDKMYLKIFIASSITTTPQYKEDGLPDFNNMSAFTFINRSEKTFKETMIKNGQKKINTYFIVSNSEIEKSTKIELSSQDGKITAYYKIN